MIQEWIMKSILRLFALLNWCKVIRSCLPKPLNMVIGIIICLSIFVILSQKILKCVWCSGLCENKCQITPRSYKSAKGICSDNELDWIILKMEITSVWTDFEFSSPMQWMPTWWEEKLSSCIYNQLTRLIGVCLVYGEPHRSLSTEWNLSRLAFRWGSPPLKQVLIEGKLIRVPKMIVVGNDRNHR